MAWVLALAQLENVVMYNVQKYSACAPLLESLCGPL